MASPASTVRRFDNVLVNGVLKVEERFWSRITLSFWIRAAGKFGAQADASNRAEYECRSVSDKLYALLCNSAAVKPLAEKGVQHLPRRTVARP